MLRKGLTDRQIYYELARVYGDSVVLDPVSLDGSTRNREGIDMGLPMGMAAIGAALAGLGLLFKRRRV